MTINISAIVAMDQDRVIGFEGRIPWHLPADLKRFAQLTAGHTVLMGRKTFDSLPAQFRPLPNRRNVVVSRQANPESATGVTWVADPELFLKRCLSGADTVSSEEIWIIGGEQIYRGTLPYCDAVEVTLVSGKHRGDTFFPEFENNFALAHDSGPQTTASPHVEEYRFLSYVRKPSDSPRG